MPYKSSISKEDKTGYRMQTHLPVILSQSQTSPGIGGLKWFTSTPLLTAALRGP